MLGLRIVSCGRERTDDVHRLDSTLDGDFYVKRVAVLPDRQNEGIGKAQPAEARFLLK